MARRRLVPVIAQDDATGEVLMLAWADARALRETRRTGRMHYWSRSRRRLWMKGETSGHVQDVVSLHWDCDRDAVLARVRPRGPACHRGTRTCFAGAPSHGVRLTDELWRLFAQRKRRAPRRSFTAALLRDPARLARKLVEEASELAMALRDGDRDGAVAEAADVLYLVYVTLFAVGAHVEDAEAVLWERRRAAR
jgi:phosphoribosyl-ATP pyrophosphohydrolase/phosphoribosyl-AMP cyclohydrolase